MSPYRKRVDANHAPIRNALRSMGWTVIDTSSVGGGMSDLILAKGGVVVFCEIKDGAKTASRTRLGVQQEAFRALVEHAGVAYRVVTSIEEAIRL